MSRKEKGRRLSTWVAKEDFWIFSAINQIQRDAEEHGLPVSRADVVRDILKKELKKYEPETDRSGV